MDHSCHWIDIEFDVQLRIQKKSVNSMRGTRIY